MKVLIITATILFSIILPRIALPQEKQPFIIKVGTLAPEGSIWMERLREITAYIEEKSTHRVKTIFYAGGVMGDEPDMVRKMRLGQLQMGAFTVHGIYSIAPEMSVMELPFLFEDFDEVDYIRKKMFPIFQEIFEKKGFKLLSWVDQGGFLQFYSKHPIRKVDDLIKHKVWAWAGEPVAIETFKAVGVSPITTSVPEVIPSLQTGLIDTFYTTPLSCLALQWYTHIKYIILVNFKYEAGAVVETLEAWNEAPADLRQVMLDAVEVFEPKAIASVRLASNRALMAMVEQGITQINLPTEERELFKKKTRVIYDQLAGKLYPKELLDMVLKELEEFRARKKGD